MANLLLREFIRPLKNRGNRSVSRHAKGAVCGALYGASIVLGAHLVLVVGSVPVGFGLTAPAAAYLIGVSLALRDLTQDQLGVGWTFAVVVAGAAVTALLSPTLALASGAAFLVSETLDLAVYTPLRTRGRIVLAVLASNAAGSVVDSLLFLGLAFGSFEYLPGQIWAKVISSLAIAGLLWLNQRKRDSRSLRVSRRNRLANPTEPQLEGRRAGNRVDLTGPS